MKSVLLIGPRYKSRRSVGGAVVLFENLITEIKNNDDVKVTVIDSYKEAGVFKSYFRIFQNVFTCIKHCDIIFFNTSRDYIIILPYLLLINLRYKKKIFLRKFGGELALKSKLCYYSLYQTLFFRHLDGIFLESKLLCSLFSKYNSNIYWFPNVREPYKRTQKSNNYNNIYNKRFVFFGQIKAEKGIDVIIQAFSQLDQTYSVDLFGYLEDHSLINDQLPKNVTYKGLLSPNEVRSVLNTYNVVVLPTYYSGEGYPGIIIEAYSCGKPVIATSWGQIPELVDDFYNGILVKPKSVSSFLSGVQHFNEDNYKEMAENALKSFKDFNSGPVTKGIIEKICS
jgi:glycosyltransferase involved in cell wall biosynthesis